MIIVQVTNKVFVTFSLKKIFLDTNTFSVSTSPPKIGVLDRNFFFNFNINKR